MATAHVSGNALYGLEAYFVVVMSFSFWLKQFPPFQVIKIMLFVSSAVQLRLNEFYVVPQFG